MRTIFWLVPFPAPAGQKATFCFQGEQAALGTERSFLFAQIAANGANIGKGGYS